MQKLETKTDAFVFDAPFIRYPFLACSRLEGTPAIPAAAPRDPGHPRIWLVRGYAGPHSEGAERIQDWGYARAEQWQGVRVEVDLWTRLPRAPE